ncbi:unnamed protein product, partial [Dovyalis caffra]
MVSGMVCMVPMVIGMGIGLEAVGSGKTVSSIGETYSPRILLEVYNLRGCESFQLGFLF